MDTQASFKVVLDGTAKVTTPATAVQLSATSIGCRRVEVHAFQENVGLVTVGASTTLATAGARRGRALAPGEVATFYVQDVNLLYIDALNANDGVSYVAYKTTS